PTDIAHGSECARGFARPSEAVPSMLARLARPPCLINTKPVPEISSMMRATLIEPNNAIRVIAHGATADGTRRSSRMRLLHGYKVLKFFKFSRPNAANIQELFYGGKTSHALTV